jgi:hypothetical protein
MFGTITRWILYGVLIALPFQLIVMGVDNVDLSLLLKEDGIVEWSQVAVLLASCLLFGIARRFGAYGRLFACMQLLLVLAVVRELDGFLYHLITKGAWKIPFTLAALALLGIAWRSRSELKQQIPLFIQSPSFLWLFCGFVIVIFYAQIIGQREFWNLVLAVEDGSRVKRIVEEVSELLGYLLILIGSIEALRLARAARRTR